MRSVLAVTTALCLIASPALATDRKPPSNQPTAAQLNATSLSQARAGASASAVGGSVTNTNNVSAGGGGSGAGDVFAFGGGGNALTSALSEKCVVGSYAFGFGLVASTYGVEHCKRTIRAQQLDAAGYKRAAAAMMCMDADTREALKYERTIICPQDEQGATATSEVPTIERKTRLGR